MEPQFSSEFQFMQMASPVDLEHSSTEEEPLFQPISEKGHLKSQKIVNKYSGTLKTSSADEGISKLRPFDMDQRVPESSSSESDVLDTKLPHGSPDSDCKIPMSEPMRKAVYAQRPQLLKVPWDNIKAELHVDAGGFLNDAEEEKIDSFHNNKAKMNRLLKYIRTKNNKAFTSFCRALVSSDYRHFAEKLSKEAGVVMEETMDQRQINTGKVLSKKESAYDWQPVLNSLRKPYNDVWAHFEKFVLGATDGIFRVVRNEYTTALAVKRETFDFSDVPRQRTEFLDHVRVNTRFVDIKLVREIAFSQHWNCSALTEAVEDYEACLKPLMLTAIHELTERCEVKPIDEISPKGTYKLVLKFPDDANVKKIYEAKTYLETCLGIGEAKLLAFDFGCILAYFEISCSPDQLEALWERIAAHSEQWEALEVSGVYLVNHWAWESKESGQLSSDYVQLRSRDNYLLLRTTQESGELSSDLSRKRSPSETGGPVWKFSKSQSTGTHTKPLEYMEDANQSWNNYSEQTASTNEEEISSPVHMDQTVPEFSSSESNVPETVPAFLLESPDANGKTISLCDNDEHMDDMQDEMISEGSRSKDVTLSKTLHDERKVPSFSGVLLSSQMTYKEFCPKPPDLMSGKELNRRAVVLKGVFGDILVISCKLLFDSAKSKKVIKYKITEFKKEADMLETVQHPHVVESLGAFYDPKTRVPLLLTELMAMNLRTPLKRSKGYGALQVTKKLRNCLQITQCLQYLYHSSPPLALQVLDLSDNNVLLAEDSTAKIGDFGQSKYKDMEQIYFGSRAPGKVLFMPPEATSDNPHYTESMDIFSLGVLEMEIITQSYPSLLVYSLGVVPEVQQRANDLKDMTDDHPLKFFVLKCVNDCTENIDHKEQPDIDHDISFLKIYKSLPTSENPASLQDKDVQGYLETQASQETVVVGPNQTVLRTTETDGNVDKHLFLPLISLPQGHPSIGNRSVEEVVREYRRLNKQELNVTRTTGDNHSRVCPLAGQSEYVGTTDSSGSYDKPLSCSLVQEATTSIQCQTQLETELQQMKEDHQKLLEKYTQMKEIRARLDKLKTKLKETLARLDKLEVQRKVEQQTWGDQRNQEVKRTFSEFWQHPHNYVSGTHHDDAYVRHKASDEMIWSSSDSSLEWRTVGNIYTQHGIYIENLDIRPHSFPFYGEVIDPIPSQVKFHRASSRGISLPLSEYYEKQLQDCEEFLSSVEERGKQDTALEELIAHVKKKISSLRTELEKSITKLQDVLDPHHGTRNSRHH